MADEATRKMEELRRKKREEEDRLAAEKEFQERFERQRRLGRDGNQSGASSHKEDSESEAESRKKRKGTSPEEPRTRLKKNRQEETEDEEDGTSLEVIMGSDPLENLGKTLLKLRGWARQPGNVKMIKKSQASIMETLLEQFQEQLIVAREQRVALETRVEERSAMIAETLRSVVREEMKSSTELEASKERPTFAQSVGRKEVPKISGVKWPVLPAPKVVVIKQDGKESEEVKKKLKELVKPSEIGLKVKRLNMVRNGVIIETESEEGIQKLMENEALKKAGMTVGKPTKKNPVVMVYDVNARLNDEAVKENIFNRNMKESEIPEEDFKKEFEIRHRYQERTERKHEGKRNHLVVECSVRVRNWLRRKGNVFIEWESCRIKDYVDVTRCFKCQRYGHVAKKCTNTKEVCSHCSGEHKYKECKKSNQREAAKCANCQREGRKEVNHPTSWRGCPVYEKAVKRNNEQIDYGI